MKLLGKILLGVALMIGAAGTASAQTAKSDGVDKVALHVNENNPQTMNLALNNVQNILADYKKSGRKVLIEVVTYGPGLHMFRADTSPVKSRVSDISLAHSNVTFSACGNTQHNMGKKEKKEIKLISEAKVVPSGVVRLIELQRQGYAYVKP